jgi:hypothetical protein
MTQVKHGRWCRAAIRAAVFSLGLFGGPWLSTETGFAANRELVSQQEVLVFYANETTRDAASSENYQRLFGALRSSGNANAERWVSILTRDAELFPAIVERQVELISQVAKASGFTAIIFTNALARRGLYRVIQSTGAEIDRPAFKTLKPAPSIVLAGYPLARPEALREAIDIVAGLPETQRRNVVLVISSHGDETMALMPRVVADLSRVARETFIAALRSRTHSDHMPTPWVTRDAGVSKQAFWQILNNTGRPLRFSMIVLDSCQSGVLTYSEYSEIPINLGKVAHSGNRYIRRDEISYDALFGGYSGEQLLSEHMAKQLRAQGIEVVPRRDLLLPLIARSILNISPFALVLPLLLWLLWLTRVLCRPARPESIKR